MDIFKSWVVTKYVAHRGLHDEKRPENSLSAFQNAIDHDVAIELDLQQLEDGTIVVFHDETLKRLTGQDGYIKKIKNVEELKTYKLQPSNETIPTFEETLKLVNGQTPLLIELKNYSAVGNFEKAVYEILKNYKGEYAIMSFNPFTLKWFRLNAPEILRGQLSSFFKGEKLSFIKKLVLKRMLLNKKQAQPNFIAYNYVNVPNRFVKKYKELPLLVWAVPSQAEYMKVAKHCDNIIFENFLPHI